MESEYKSETFWLSNLLQDRHCRANPNDRNRSEWHWTQFSTGSREGRKEIRFSDWCRVENVELLELRDSRLDKFRDAEGTLYLYDLRAKQHHSFCVNDVLVHNCGTVGSRLGEDLLATGARVIACGDPYQLRPVRDSRFFEDEDDSLTEVHRQAWDSAIIRQAHAVKDGDEYQADGEDFRVISKAELTKGDLTFGGIALCWRNLTRQRLNLSRRRALGYGGPALEVGEPVMILKNDHRLRVFNGEIYAVQTRRPLGEDLQIQDATGRSVVLRNVTVEGIDADFETRRYEDDWTPVCLAYATTVHKFIGSEDQEVLFVDEYVGNERQNFVYTALTRAAKRILIVQP